MQLENVFCVCALAKYELFGSSARNSDIMVGYAMALSLVSVLL